METAGVYVLLTASDAHHMGDVRYLTDHAIWSQNAYAVISKNAGPFLVVPMASQNYWARTQSWASEVRWSPTPIREAVALVKSLASEGKTLGVSGLANCMSSSDSAYLREQLPSLRIHDATRLVQTVRSHKSAEEHAHVSETAEIASAGFARLRECARPGVTEFELAGEVERVVRSRGAGETLLLTSQGPYLRRPSGRKLERGDFQMFSIELSGPSGYWVELGGMLAIGDIDDAARSAYEACRRAFEAGVQQIVVGARPSDVAQAVQAAFAASGHRPGIWGGHGIGLDTLEEPRLIAAEETRIAEGMTFGFHPHVVDASGRYGAYIADTVIATATGPLRLARFGEAGTLVFVEA